MDIPKVNLEDEIFRVEKQNIEPVPFESIKEIFSILKYIDQDMSSLLDILFRVVESVDDTNLQTITLHKVLKFYGFNNTDILSSRQKFVNEDGVMVKQPFLKKSQRESIQMLLEQLGIEVI